VNVITTEGEHSAVYECFRELKTRGVEVRFAPLKPNGGVDENALLSLVDEKTTFVSVVHVNNETGAINDINALSRAIKHKNPNVVFHSDGVQAFGKLPVKIGETVDLYSASAHKIGGVKGTGVLIKKKGLKLQPLIFGGGQERGLRIGTENVFGISVFATVYDKKAKAISENFEKIQGFKRDFLSAVDGCGIKVVSDEKCSPYVLSLSAVGLRGEVLQHMMEDEGVIIGTGSACSSRHRHSRILTACGYGTEILDGALRISFSPENTREEVLFAAENLMKCYNKLKGVMKK
ncbi:MAG: aminotransferase class V-fold PLP-dependent enzyme, partial [Clostridia bacterium]|nr:aminotransferase class V-fold PLP-dependent enzyme [Clostridia bacterium]